MPRDTRRSTPYSRFANYGFALVAVFLAVLLRWALDPIMGDTLPLVTLFGAVAAAVWLGGYGPAITVVGIGYLACSYLFIEPGGDSARNIVGFIAYLLTCSIIVVFGELLRRSNRFAEMGRERLQITIASVGDAVITTDSEGNVTMLNRVAEHLTGWTQQEAIGKPLQTIFNIVTEQTREPVDNPVQRVLSLKRIVGLANHTVLIAKDGTERPIDDSAAPIRSPEGRIEGVVLVFHDVSEKRKAERQLKNSDARKTAIFQTALDCIITIDEEGKVLEFNRAAEETFGYSRESALGKELAELIIPPALRDRHRRAMAHYRSTGEGPILNRRIELPALKASGEEIRVELAVTAVPVDGASIFTAYIRDITERERLARAERESRELLHATLLGIGDAVIATDEQGQVVFLNPIAEQLTGWSQSEAKGKPLTTVFDIVNEKTRQEAPNPALRALQQGVIVGLANHTILISKSGAEYPIDDSAAPIRNQSEQVTGAVLVFRDITQRRIAEDALRRSEERLRQAQEVASIGTFEWNIQTGVSTWTPELEAMYGLKPGTFGGSQESWENLIHSDDRAKTITKVQEALETGQFQAEWRVEWPDGSVHWLAGRASVFRDAQGKPERLLGVNIDITTRKVMEDELRRVAAELSETNRRKDEFLATLAHELRNPLAPLGNGLQILRLSGGSPESLKQTRTMMERQLSQLVRLVDDLLDLSRISRGKIELRKEHLPLAAVIQSAVETTLPIIQASGHDLSVEVSTEPIFVNADLTRLAQVFANLLNNAAKYTEPRGKIWVNATKDDSEAIISVKDTGIGIPQEMISRVFDMFTQIDRSLDRSQGGLGIGLTLSKRLVELHGGAIEAQSDGENRGSTFTVRLPIVSATSSESERSHSTMQSPSISLRILVADDNTDATASMARVLTMLGHEVKTAINGLEAAEIASEFRPALIFLDIGMPKLNGYEACRKIKDDPWASNAVFVALTGWGQEDDKRKSKEAGFDHHLIKPSNLETLERLLSTVQEAIKG